MNRFSSRRLAPALVLLFVVSLAIPGIANARAIKVISPKSGTALPVNSEFTFKVRDKSRDAKRLGVFVTISTSKKAGRGGDLRKTQVGTFSSMQREGNVFSYETPDHIFPTWFMNRAGTYYWQAYHIDSTCLRRDCHVRSKVMRFTVQ